MLEGEAKGLLVALLEGIKGTEASTKRALLGEQDPSSALCYAICCRPLTILDF